jgi:hypothetical protein
MISQDLLDEAKKLIGGDRQTKITETNSRIIENIANFWSIFLKKKLHRMMLLFVWHW